MFHLVNVSFEEVYGKIPILYFQEQKIFDKTQTGNTKSVLLLLI